MMKYVPGDHNRAIKDRRQAQKDFLMNNGIPFSGRGLWVSSKKEHMTEEQWKEYKRIMEKR